MGFWNTMGRIGKGVISMGASEIGGGGLGDTAFGKIKQAQGPDKSLYEYGGSPEYAQNLRNHLQARSFGSSTRDAYQLDRAPVNEAMARFTGAYAGNDAALRDEGMSRAEQQQALGMYRDAAMGKAPSVAAAQMTQGLEESSRLGQNLAAGAIGANPLLASSNAASASADAARRSTSAAAALRAQEIDAARAGYAGLSGQMRQGDLARGQAFLDRGNAALGAGQFGFGASQAQGALEMQQRGLNDQQQQAYDNFLLQMNRDALAGQMGYGNAQTQVSLGNAGNSVQRRGQNQEFFNSTLDSFGNAAGMAGGMPKKP